MLKVCCGSILTVKSCVYRDRVEVNSDQKVVRVFYAKDLHFF